MILKKDGKMQEIIYKEFFAMNLVPWYLHSRYLSCIHKYLLKMGYFKINNEKRI